MNTSDLIAFGALILSIGSVVFSSINNRKLNKQQRQINDFTITKERMNEENSKKAFIEARSSYNSGSVTVTIFNTGNAVAKNIRMNLPYDDKDGIIITNLPFPYPQINAHSSGAKFYLFLNEGHVNPVNITFIWDDDFSNDNQAIQFLQL